MKTPKKILIEYEKKDNTTDNFRFGFSKFLELTGYSYSFKCLNDITEVDLNWCNIYIAVRPNTPISTTIARKIKQSGRIYIVFFDDDLINRPDSIKWRNKSSKKCLEQADMIFGVNPILCEEYGRYTKHYFSINTAVDESELLYPHHSEGKIQFVYAAGRDHASIFETIISPVLRRFLDEYHEKVHFTFIGAEPRIESVGFKDNFSYVPLMPLKKYTEFMKTHAFDVGLAPLEDNRFTNMKYFNKYIEYAKTGIAGVYSDVKPYTFVLMDRKNGYLVKNTETAWYEILKYCVEHIEDVRKVGLNAQNDLRKKFALEHITNELKKHLDSVMTENVPTEIHWKRNIMVELLFWCNDMAGKLIYLVRSRGIRETIKAVLRKIVGKTV